MCLGKSQSYTRRLTRERECERAVMANRAVRTQRAQSRPTHGPDAVQCVNVSATRKPRHAQICKLTGVDVSAWQALYISTDGLSLDVSMDVLLQ